jgi:hypothetical protein
LKPQAIGSNPLKRVQESIEVRVVVSGVQVWIVQPVSTGFND